MTQVINASAEETPLTFQQELQQLRDKLNGKPYTKGIQALLPDMTPWQIRNVINGRREDKLVLRALRLFVHKKETTLSDNESRLQEEELKAGLEGA